MKGNILNLLALLCVVNLSAALFISDVVVNGISHSSARIGWTTDTPGMYFIEYGPTTSYGYKSLPKSVPNDKTTGALVITGMAPSSTTYFRICLDQSACSDQQQLTTSESASSTPALPQMFEVAVPTINGKTFQVNNYCTDLEEQYSLALQEDTNLNHEIVIPSGAICASVVFKTPHTRNGTILIRSADVSSLPAPKTRMEPTDQDLYATNMAKIYNTVIPATYGAPASNCEDGHMYYDTDNKYYVVCNGGSTTEISPNKGETIPTGQCTIGDYYYYTPNESQGLYYCYDINGGIWVKRSPSFGGLGGTAVYMTGQVGLYFLGIEFTAPAQHMFYISGLVFAEGNNERITFDRCIFRNPKVLTSELRSTLSMSGNYMALVGSLIDFRAAATSSQAINIIGRAGPFRITDNFIRGSGILLFANDDDPTLPRDDFEIRRNIFSYDELHRSGSDTYDGAGFRDVRGPIEFKRGRRILFEGNIVESYWSTLSGGQAIIITPRAPDDPPLTNEAEISDVTIRNNIFRHGSGGIQITGQDDAGYRSTKISARYLIENNLFYDIDAFHWADNTYGPTRGQILALALGGEDIQFIHNTVIYPKGTGPAFLHGSYGAQNGLVMRDNILWLNKGEAGGGAGIRWSEPNYLPTSIESNTLTTALDLLNNFALEIPDPKFEFTNNVIITTLDGDKELYESGYPGGNFWPGDNTTGVDIVKFKDYNGNDYRLADDSPYKGRASDGTDPGVDYNALQQALQGGDNHAPSSTSGTPISTPGNKATSGSIQIATEISLMIICAIILLI